MAYCPRCGAPVNGSSPCQNCGTRSPHSYGGICPKCGSSNVQIITDINGKTKGFGFGKGCLGWLIIGPMGWLCGLCGMGKGKTTTNVYRMCADCGAKFK